ncbi:MAG: hypothetical protein J6D53_10025 [Blautia sp.]|nr:hypothetical protein [Blautia sp.]
MSFPYKVVRHEKSHESAEDYLENILILRERKVQEVRIFYNFVGEVAEMAA